MIVPIRPLKSAILSRLHLVDPFSLTVQISRRRCCIFPSSSILNSTSNSASTSDDRILLDNQIKPNNITNPNPQSQSPAFHVLPQASNPSEVPLPPGLLLAWEQPQCTLRLSDMKLVRLKRCWRTAFPHFSPSDKSADAANKPLSPRPDSQSYSSPEDSINLGSERRPCKEAIRPNRSGSLSQVSSTLTPDQGIPFGWLRRQLVASFRMQELILQLETRGKFICHL
ncbi:unnamed protein product [Protopolystoma xenopodis]|uniref:Uncharacterized protein n=1 Tax=Protopolystoma xenopodis TaxID=117903 RepID=A0A3S5ACL9_9PLAT|nr:unnamed protein product [Protopolystoma xenopodis]